MYQYSFLRLLALGILLSIVIVSAVSCASTTPIPSDDKVKGPYKLELLKWKWYQSSNWIIVAEGRVKNVSPEELDDLTAVVTFYDKNGKLIKNDQRKIERDTLLPGKVSPFRVIASSHPKAVKARIDFKDFEGNFIPTDRQQPALQPMLTPK